LSDGSNSISKLERGVEVEGVLLITNTLKEDDKREHDVEEVQRLMRVPVLFRRIS